MKFSIILVLFFLIVTSCTEPVDFDFETPPTKLVVDGFITDLHKNHVIKLSYTSSLENNIPIQRSVDDAIVNLVDDESNVINLRNIGLGRFITPLMAAQPERSYRLQINLGNDDYETDFEKLPTSEFSPMTELSAEFDRRKILSSQGFLTERSGAAINVKIKKSTRSIYYNWLMSDCYVPKDQPLFEGIRYCQTYSLEAHQVYLHLDLPKSEIRDVDYKTELRWVVKKIQSPLDSSKRLIEVEQYLISQQAFEYWTKVKESVESVGSLFDPAPTSIRGNIYNANTNAPVLGYFGVYRGSWDRVELGRF